jgi:deoxyribodipyrimidine photo-lyase
MKTYNKISLTQEQIIPFLKNSFPNLIEPKELYSPSLKDLEYRLSIINPIKYGHTRNYLDGAITHLSRYVSSGLISTSKIIEHCIHQFGYEASLPLIKQLVWRVYFKHKLYSYPHATTQNIDNYKTGLQDEDYSKQLPEDVLNASTPNNVINVFIQTLIDTGYLHNHARLYLSSYLIHFRRIHWKVGADWMFTHLVDADIASHYCSWQWVASTGSSKPYLFNLENISKYAYEGLPIQPQDNPELVGSYEDIANRCFSKKGAL